MLWLIFKRFGLFFPAAAVLVWRLRLVMLKLRPVKLAGMARRLFLLASFFMLGALSATTAALSAKSGEAIIVPVHKVKVVTLDRNAGVVLIANPTIADVAVENKRMIFLFGLEPGETNLLILDTAGEEILTAPVVVVPILERRVTVNRASANEVATFSCAPRCAAVATPAGTGAEIQSTGSEAGASASEKEAEAAEAEKEDTDDFNRQVDTENKEVRADNKQVRAYNKSIGVP